MNRRSIWMVRLFWVLATAALTVAWRVEALVLLIPLALVGPVLREVHPASDVDERERAVDYHASHIALLVVYLLLFVLFAETIFIRKAQPAPEWYTILAVPLIVRVVLSVGRGAGARRLGLWLGFSFGGIWLAFTLLSHGFSPASLIESAVGGLMLGATALALRWPRLGGTTLVIGGVLFLGVFAGAQAGRSHWTLAVLLTSVLALPPMIAGIALLGSARADRESGGDEFADLRGAPPVPGGGADRQAGSRSST